MQISQNGVDKLQIEIIDNTAFQAKDYGISSRKLEELPYKIVYFPEKYKMVHFIPRQFSDPNFGK